MVAMTRNVVYDVKCALMLKMIFLEKNEQKIMVRIFKKKKAPLLTTIYRRPYWAAGVGQSAQM